MRDYSKPYISYSGYKKYLECPQAYYLEYVLRERPEVEDSRNTLNGNALHKLLEEWIQNGENDPKWLLQNCVRVWKEHHDAQKLIIWRNPDDKKQVLKKYIKWTQSLAKLVVEANIDPAMCKSEVKTDTDVIMDLDKGKTVVRLGGRIDVLRQKADGNYIFFDLKGSENRAIMQLEQIVWYAMMMGLHLKDADQPIAGGYILPGFNEIKMYRITPEAKSKLYADIVRVINAIQNEEFEGVHDDKKYWFCPVKHKCCSAPVQIPQGTGTMNLFGDIDE